MLQNHHTKSVKLVSANFQFYLLTEHLRTFRPKGFLALQSLTYIEGTTKLAGLFGTMPQEPWHPAKGAKPDRIIWLNCEEAHTHASYKTTRTWENFNNQGTKMIFLSDELWLIANNSKSFANGIQSMIRNNLGLRKHSEIYLI